MQNTTVTQVKQQPEKNNNAKMSLGQKRMQKKEEKKKKKKKDWCVCVCVCVSVCVCVRARTISCTGNLRVRRRFFSDMVCMNKQIHNGSAMANEVCALVATAAEKAKGRGRRGDREE